MSIHLIKNIISEEDNIKLKNIHSSSNPQNKLKNTLLKFDLGPDAIIDRDYNFNIWCKPLTDGAGDFSLMNKIGKELLSYGIPHDKLNFILGTRNYTTFLRELTNYIKKTDDIKNQLTTKIVSVNARMESLKSGIDFLQLGITNIQNNEEKIKHINYQIKDNYTLPEPNIFDKNINYDTLEELHKLIEKLTSENKKNREEIRNNLEGDIFGTFIPFVFSRIIKEFPNSHLYIFDIDRFNIDGDEIHRDKTQINQLYSQIIQNCRFDSQSDKTINLQLLPFIPTLNDTKIFNGCDDNKVFYLNEGGNIVLGNDHCMGIGERSLGIFKADTDQSRQNILTYLNDSPQQFIEAGETQITKYHIVYVGQTLMYEINKDMEGKKFGQSGFDEFEHKLAICNLQRVFLFLKLLKQKYLEIKEQTIHIFILDVFKKILEIFNSGLQSVFNEYDYKTNTFRVNESTVLKLKFFKRIEQNKFIAFIKHSEPIMYSTGDQSYQEALSLGKLVFHDYIDHRMSMVDNLLKCYNIVNSTSNNNYKLFIDNHLKKISEIGSILDMSFDIHIINFFNDRKIISELNNTLLDYFDETNQKNKKFYDFFMKHYDFSKEFKKIIFLMQNNALDKAINNNILISQDFEREFNRIDESSYKQKYLKYKQKYLNLKNKLKGGTIAFTDKDDGSKQLFGLEEERSKHSPIFTNNQKIITESLFKYLNEKIKFKLSINYKGESKVVLGNYLIKNLTTGKVLGRGANGIAIEFDNNIVIKISKMMATNPSIIENEIQNMIELYKSEEEYNFRDSELVKLLGVVYMNAEYNLIKKFDRNRTHIIEDFNIELEKPSNNDRIGFVIMEKYQGDLSSLNMSTLTLSQKYDIATQMIQQLNTLFNKNYFHTDLHDGNWFYKKIDDRIIIRIADYGSETKKDARIGVFRFSEKIIKEKEKSLRSSLVAFTNKGLLSHDELYTLLDVKSYTDLLKRVISIINENYFDRIPAHQRTDQDELNKSILYSISG